MFSTNIYKWLNSEKSRYFTITTYRGLKSNGTKTYAKESYNDITNVICMIYDWGSCHSNRGGKKIVIAKTIEEANDNINKMMKRRKSRGYELITPLSNTSCA